MAVDFPEGYRFFFPSFYTCKFFCHHPKPVLCITPCIFSILCFAVDFHSVVGRVAEKVHIFVLQVCLGWAWCGVSSIRYRK